MKQLPGSLIFLLVIAFMTGPVYPGRSQKPAEKILQQLSDKLNSCQTISYQYFRGSHYFSEDYHNETAASTFIDFQSTDTILGFKFQFDTEEQGFIFNGTESFQLNKKEKTLKTNNKPTLDDFASTSFWVNSLVTLEKVLPVLIADKTLEKTLADTLIGPKHFHLISFVLQNKTISGLGSFSPITLKRAFLYRLILDKETLLPLQVIQTNDAEPADYMLTAFSDVQINGAAPTELSWYPSTYSKTYQPAPDEKILVPIEKNTLAPDWQLPWADTHDSIALHDLKGKVILLEFWMKNCGHCIAAVPGLNALAEKYKTKKFELIGINAHDSKEGIQNFYQRTKPNFKTAIDHMNVTLNYGIQGFPTVVLLDKKGVVLYAGSYDQELLDTLIIKALK